jgi:pilus assembly protein Flp/PilA
MIANITHMLSDESGATMVEYGLMIALIAMAAIVAVKGIGTGLSTIFTNVGNSL